MSKMGFNNLKRDVINTGLCTACGTCVGVCVSKAIIIDYETDEEHKLISEDIVESVKKNRKEDLSQKVLLAASRRQYLG